METTNHGYSGDLVPGMLVVPAWASRFESLDTFVDETFEKRGFPLTRDDGLMLIVANVVAHQIDVTYRPTLVLTSSGRLAWVVDFRLQAIAEGGW